MSECDLCNEEAQLIHGTFMKRSDHGGPVELCDDCWGLLDRPRCALCGTTDLPDDPGRRHSVTEHGDAGRGGVVCETCRTVLDWNH